MKDRSELFNHLYEQLRRLAHNRLFNENGPKDATSLVHEAYLKLRTWDASFQSDEHFLSTASKVMRQILVDYARRRNAGKRGGAQHQITLHDYLAPREDRSTEVLALDQALQRLQQFDPRAARVVEMHFFGGLSFDEMGLVLGVSPRTARRDWRMARAWLRGELSSGA